MIYHLQTNGNCGKITESANKGADFVIKNVLLDLDDTLLDFKRAEAIAIRDTFIELNIDPSEENIKLYSTINRSCWARLELGELTRDEVLHNRFDILFQKLGIEGDSHKSQEIYEYKLSFGAFYLDGAEELLNTLQGKYRLYLATNGIIKVQTRRIADSGIGKYFDDIFISEKIGYNKPDKRFFDISFNTIPDFKQEETVIIGDTLTSDIKGGINAGIRTVYFNPGRKENKTDIIPDYEIHSLSELPQLIEKM